MVVPRGAVPAKLAAIRAYGARLHECEPTMAAREAAVAKLQADTGARLVHPFTDPLVIAGQGTAALELLAQSGGLDVLITPLGGGGLVGGTATAVAGLGVRTRVIGAEPAGASEAHDSLVRGDAAGARGQRERGAVVAGRVRDHAARGFAFAQRPDGIAGAAELEGAAALQVLALEVQLRAGQFVECARAQRRRDVGVRRDARGRGEHVLELGQGDGVHAVSVAGAGAGRALPSRLHIAEPTTTSTAPV